MGNPWRTTSRTQIRRRVTRSIRLKRIAWNAKEAHLLFVFPPALGYSFQVGLQRLPRQAHLFQKTAASRRPRFDPTRDGLCWHEQHAHQENSKRPVAGTRVES